MNKGKLSTTNSQSRNLYNKLMPDSLVMDQALSAGELQNGTKSSFSLMSANAEQIKSLKAISRKNYGLQNRIYQTRNGGLDTSNLN